MNIKFSSFYNIRFDFLNPALSFSSLAITIYRISRIVKIEDGIGVASFFGPFLICKCNVISSGSEGGESMIQIGLGPTLMGSWSIMVIA